MPYEKLIFEVHNKIATITMNAPDRLNAMDEIMHRDLANVWHEINDRDDIWVSIITGAGRAFCTGADVKEAAGAMTEGRFGPDRWERGGNFVEQYNRTGVRRYQNRGMPVPTRGLPGKPMIAAVNGMCAGGGLHFVCRADFAIAATDATFFDPHVNVAVVPSHETLDMSRTVPRSVALAIAFMGLRWRMDAQRAYELGFVTELVEPDKLMERARDIAETIVTYSAPKAVQAAKANIWQGWNMPVEHAKVYTRIFLNQVRWQTEDAKEGPRAFVEKRKPNWQGR